jgi:hypothetical protein
MMLSFQVWQLDDKVKRLYSIGMAVLQHILIPAFFIAQLCENMLLINDSKS